MLSKFILFYFKRKTAKLSLLLPLPHCVTLVHLGTDGSEQI